jgi:8-oxo-dGTP pyrophosphatase MutT (NUDIX family)
LSQELLAAELRQYRGVDGTEEAFRGRMLELVEQNALYWHRDTMPGHITASAYLVSPQLDCMLLHFHRKLERWLQVGGHDDGEKHPAKAVVREVAEESGLQQFDFFGDPVIFDLDIHPIPGKGDVPGHDHLDVRYLMIADPNQPLCPAEGESQELQWFSLEEAEIRLNEAGASRVLNKIRVIAQARAQLNSK